MKRLKKLPPAYFKCSVIGMILLHVVLPGRTIINSPYNYTGIVLILTGLLLNLWSSNAFKKADTTIKPFEESASLITDGVFKYSRNPMYIGMIAALIGLWIVLGSLTPLLVIPVFTMTIAYHFIPAEERNMEMTFGEQYINYTRTVRRWI